jgi:hypothetical protein
MGAARSRLTVALSRCAGGLCIGLLFTGCATHTLNRARHEFYAGQPEQAEQALEGLRIPRRDEVLFLMERGAVRQARGDYEASTRDFLDAYERLVELETYSLSRGAGSLMVNDQIRHFAGAPFERTLLHAMTAANHFARGAWDDAAIEARRILWSLDDERRGNFPDEPYSRYLAGLAFELIDDPSNAALQYRRADALLPQVAIDPVTGRLAPAAPPKEAGAELHGAWPVQAGEPGPAVPPDTGHELIVGLQLGRSRGTAWGTAAPNHSAPLYAEIHADGVYLGRTYTLSDTASLRAETERVRALREAAKSVTRIAIKEGIAVAVESNNENLGGLVRFILIGLLEQPDLRRWETLPRWFQIARVPAPAGLDAYTVVLKGRHGQTLRSFEVREPLQRRRHQTVSFVRDLSQPPP